MEEEKPISKSGYLGLVKRNSYNFIFAGILLVLYELTQLMVSGPVKTSNAIDVLFQYVFSLVPYGSTLVSLFLVLVGLIYIYQDKRQGIKIKGSILGYMWLESLGWGLIIYLNLAYLVSNLNNTIAMSAGNGISYFQEISLSLGAGFYEELFFRLILVKLTVFILMIAGMKQKAWQTTVITVIITAILFSVAHFDFILGASGDPWSWYLFIYRTIFGVMMSLLLVFRGFGIAAWSHALYDVLVFSFQ